MKKIYKNIKVYKHAQIYNNKIIKIIIIKDNFKLFENLFFKYYLYFCRFSY